MYRLVIGYVHGEMHHAYIKDLHGESKAVNFTLATCLFRQMIVAGHEMHHVVLSEAEGNSFDWIEF